MSEMTTRQSPSPGPRAVAIGAFDGVHLGHAAVVRPVLEAAERMGIPSAALTFEPTPRQYFARTEDEKQRLTLDDERRELLCRLGVQQILVQTFDEELRQMTPERFARQVLCERLDARFVSIGASHTFGNRRSGGPGEIVELGRQLGFEVHVEPLAEVDGSVVSSTQVRRALAEGDMGAVGRMLGRPYTVTGRVVEGESRGKGLGYPTANTTVSPRKLLPAAGVYVGAAVFEGDAAEAIPAAVNLGQAPTFGVSEPRLEAHLIDFEGDVYGERLTIGFLARLRSIQAFGQLDELRDQLQQDVADTRRIFAQSAARTEASSP
jgi:riboflavin kinase/FMN adenylyltransferase